MLLARNFPFSMMLSLIFFYRFMTYNSKLFRAGLSQRSHQKRRVCLSLIHNEIYRHYIRACTNGFIKNSSHDLTKGGLEHHFVAELVDSMGESNTVASAYTLYRHLQQYCSHPSNCMVLNAVFSTISVITRAGQCIYSYLSGVFLIGTSLYILSKPLAAFSHKHRRNNGKN